MSGFRLLPASKHFLHNLAVAAKLLCIMDIQKSLETEGHVGSSAVDSLWGLPGL